MVKGCPQGGRTRAPWVSSGDVAVFLMGGGRVGFHLTANEWQTPARKKVLMVHLHRYRSRPYPPNQEAVSEARSTLLARARKGDSQAQVNLMVLYGVRAYAEAERTHTTVMEFLTQSARTTRRKK